VNEVARTLPSYRAVALFVLLVILALAAAYVIAHIRAVEKVERDWQTTRVEKLTDFGSTRQLTITPLLNWHAGGAGLRTEAGVSYLIQTDQHRLLFDVGFNQNNEPVSPLQHNMVSLGIKLESIDTLFISHHHLDHAGGQSWVDSGSFSLGQQQSPLAVTKIFSPVPLQYPGSTVEVVRKPVVVGEGLASIGPIRRRLFMGEIEEQALAINVADKGIVLVVGCGHQTLTKILQRYDQLFDQPLYAIIGDLHYPLPDGRLTLLGINLQRYLASGSGPWNPIDEKGVRADMGLLQARNLSILGLGGHDTSDTAIDWFKNDFGRRYRSVRVGDAIEIN
jgi:metal-dependent hydrolase (beta-lactamase superfamily II)